ncbi:type II toxin-antitoxin system VapC family toxin [Candidatus Latescibacterota bacterium]
MGDRPVVLDTHVWIWLLNGDRALSPQAREAARAAAETGQVLVSPISVWEVGMLEARGRISFGADVGEWVRQGLAAPGICLAPLTPQIALASSRLPGSIPGDPADRLIVATARAHDAVLVTRDRDLLAYSEGGFVAACAA